MGNGTTASRRERKERVTASVFAREVGVGDTLVLRNQGGKIASLGVVRTVQHPSVHGGACKGVHIECDKPSFDGCYNFDCGKVEVSIDFREPAQAATGLGDLESDYV